MHRKRRSARVGGRAGIVLEHWDAAAREIMKGFVERDGRSRPRWDTTESYLKVQVYVLVNRLNTTRDTKKFALALRERVDLREFPLVEFADAPYRWAFKALNHLTAISISRHNTLRWGNELLYAARHMVPPEYLIGFIGQIGGANTVSKKLKAGELEPWFTPELRSIAKERSLSYYPLSVHEIANLA